MSFTFRSDPTQAVVVVNGVDQMFIKDSGKAEVRTAGTTGLEVATAGQMLGVGQSWQDLTASRAVNTSYTNTTGKPIVVAVRMAISAVAAAQIVINGVTIIGQSQGSVGVGAFIEAVVPAGATYSAGPSSGTASSLVWWELRS